MEQSKAMEYESRKASSNVLKPRDIYIIVFMFLEQSHFTLQIDSGIHEGLSFPFIHKHSPTYSTVGCPYGQHFYVDILCCIHIFFPQKTHNATLFYRGTCIQGRRHLVTAAMSVQ
jgi:hypothetical protein